MDSLTVPHGSYIRLARSDIGGACGQRFGPRGSRPVRAVIVTCRFAGGSEDFEQLADVLFACDRGADREVSVDRVLVAAAVSLACDVAGCRQLGHDAVRGPLCDPDPIADLSQPDTRILGDADQHEGVVGQKRPVPRGVDGHGF